VQAALVRSWGSGRWEDVDDVEPEPADEEQLIGEVPS
jgi:hypothetical protein